MQSEEVVFKYANNSSDLLSNRTVIYATNLLLHRKTEASAQTLAENWWGKDPLGPACI